MYLPSSSRTMCIFLLRFLIVQFFQEHYAYNSNCQWLSLFDKPATKGKEDEAGSMQKEIYCFCLAETLLKPSWNWVRAPFKANNTVISMHWVTQT